MNSVSVIGCGNMGSALIRGLADTEYTVTACDVDEAALEAVAGAADRTTADIDEAAAAPLVVLAVKPDVITTVLDALDLSADQTLCSVAAGVETDVLAARTDATVCRLMPNLAAEYGEMAAAMTPPGVDDARAVFASLGTVVELDEELMHLATAINGSGPAFVFYLIDAMQTAGVEGGMDPDDARALATQTFRGAAETIQRSDRRIEASIDAVCSPNGTTIEGMHVLWDGDCADQLQSAITAAEHRSKELAAEVDHE
ncbi:pyrroline-5-carboxylate reductase [Halococcoides cellulosivorans]|uniref:Pyrroline-5-carboxylate reductase n=1 Tax=Halococcoides cellulosivorans TaxID=1679096 RepID=A0A2R4WZ41_9EURY|nr:pyrroline-5-carboxylate reductase [Halococcoides cellulosivorans]AWB26812.1 pyrroline-5-carboxylate reductase [Halococcoides cellulosivorans]